MQKVGLVVTNTENLFKILAVLKAEYVLPKDIKVIGPTYIELKALGIKTPGIFWSSDARGALIRGTYIGGALGILSSLLLFKTHYLELSFVDYLALNLFGMGFGAWVSSMIGVSVYNPFLKQFVKDLDQGKLVVIVNLPKPLYKKITKKLSPYIIKHIILNKS